MKGALKPGQSVSLARRFTADDARALHTLTGAPLETARVPEALINGLFSCLLGVDLPGRGTNYLKQETRFLADAPLGETLTATVEITGLRPDKHLVDLATTCTTQDGLRIAEGRALVLARDVAGAFQTPA